MESLGKSQGKKPRERRPQGLWRCDFLKDCIHHDTPKAFPHLLILLSSGTSKEGFLLANGLPRKYHGKYIILNDGILKKTI